MRCWNQTQRGCCHIDNQTWAPGGLDPKCIVVVDPIIQKPSFLELQKPAQNFYFGVRNNMHHSMSELRFQMVEYAIIGNSCAGWLRMGGRRYERDLATFGINAVCFLFVQPLALFTLYPSHSVWKEWGTTACSCNTSSGLELHFSFQPGQR
jgi:hypothetical protein